MAPVAPLGPLTQTVLGQHPPVFSYYRERIFKNRKGYFFEGKVHEAICPQGKIIFENIAVEHRKTKPSSPMRNLLIYQQSLCEGSILSTRDFYYYANELYQNNMPAQALAVYSEYRKRKDTFLPDLVQSFVNSSNILLDKNRCDEALSEILRALAYTRPTPTVLCQIGYVLPKTKKVRFEQLLLPCRIDRSRRQPFFFRQQRYVGVHTLRATRIQQLYAGRHRQSVVLHFKSSRTQTLRQNSPRQQRILPKRKNLLQNFFPR